MNKSLALSLPLIALLVTGCPHNEYELKLRPHDGKLERELVFHSEDGKETSGVPKYQVFPEEELAAITALYPAGGLTNQGEIYTAKGEFIGVLPGDVGGAGTYTNITTSLGSAGFYVERFRGEDDLAGKAEKRLAAANQLTDLVIGWTQKELGRETNFAALHKFLDTDFRKDLKNAAFYWKQANFDFSTNANNDLTYSLRFTQYLMERGYLKPSEIPELFTVAGQSSTDWQFGIIQRIIAKRLGLTGSQPFSPSLAFLRDSEAMGKSFEAYFTNTDIYHAKVAEWRKKKGTSEEDRDVGEIMMEQVEDLLDINLKGDPFDHLTVRLSLPLSPTHSNGEWNQAGMQLVWKSEIERRTNSVRLPLLCYASWAQPDEGFQKQHFGGVILIGDDLIGYCLWRATLNDKQGEEWEKLLAGLQSSDGLTQKVKALYLSDEKPATERKDQEKNPGYLGRAAIENALNGMNLQGQPSEASKSN